MDEKYRELAKNGEEKSSFDEPKKMKKKVRDRNKSGK
jgi:hypothetical protein